MGTRRKGSDRFAILDVLRREMGLYQPRQFLRRISGTEALVKQIDRYAKLKGHRGCVNTVEFNSAGDLLISGSDDKQVMLWNWETKNLRCSYDSGHTDNIFQAKFMPFTDDSKIITCGADGQVRLGQVSEKGQIVTKKLGKHQSRVHKLALEPGSPHIFFSCGEDGVVQHFDLRSESATKLFSCSSFSGDKPSLLSIRLNAIVVNPRNPNYFSVGGSDEYARVYDIRKYHCDASSDSDRPVDTFCPSHLTRNDDVHITGLAYSNSSDLLVSYNDELIYLFEKGMGIGPDPLSASVEDLQKSEDAQVYLGHRNAQTVKGVSFFGPNDEYVMTGSDCGHIFIWTKKTRHCLRVMPGDRQIVNHCESHPNMPVIATCGIEKNVKVWAPKSGTVLALPPNVEEIMELNRRGREDRSRVSLTPDVIMHVLRLHRRQALAYIDRRYNTIDIESEEDEGEIYGSESSEGDISSGDCNIN